MNLNMNLNMKLNFFLATLAFISISAISCGAFSAETGAASSASNSSGRVFHGGDWDQPGLSLRHLHFWFT